MTSVQEAYEHVREGRPEGTRLGVQEILLLASGLLALAEEEVHGWVRKLLEKNPFAPDETSRLLGEALRGHREATALLERWLEERIGKVRPHAPPFSKELKRLQQRVSALRDRVRALSDALGCSD